MDSTFNLIIRKIINLDNNFFSYNYDKTDKVSGIHKIFFNLFLSNQLNNCKSKFDLLKDIVDNFYFKNKIQQRNDFFLYRDVVLSSNSVIERFFIVAQSFFILSNSISFMFIKN